MPRSIFPRTAAILLLAAFPSFSGAEPLSPTLSDILSRFSDDNFNTRDHAATDLQLFLAHQLKTLMTAEDPEVSAQLREAATDQARLIEWTVRLTGNATPANKDLLIFALSDAIVPHLVNALSDKPDAQRRGLSALVVTPDPQIDAILASLIDPAFPDRCLNVIDALKNRPASAPVVDALWKLFDAGFSVRGKKPTTLCVIPVANYLAQHKDRVATAPFDTFIANMPKVIFWNAIENEDSFAAFWTLTEAFPTDAALTFVYKSATGPMASSSSTAVFYHSNRTPMLALFTLLTHQGLNDYALSHATMNGQRMWYSTSEGAENNAIKKANEWWANHPPGTLPPPAPINGNG